MHIEFQENLDILIITGRNSGLRDFFSSLLLGRIKPKLFLTSTKIEINGTFLLEAHFVNSTFQATTSLRILSKSLAA